MRRTTCFQNSLMRSYASLICLAMFHLWLCYNKLIQYFQSQRYESVSYLQQRLVKHSTRLWWSPHWLLEEKVDQADKAGTKISRWLAHLQVPPPLQQRAARPMSRSARSGKALNSMNQGIHMDYRLVDKTHRTPLFLTEFIAGRK
jgi:hypothetical protein